MFQTRFKSLCTSTLNCVLLLILEIKFIVFCYLKYTNHICTRIKIRTKILSETIENTNSESEDQPEKKKEITAVSIQQANHSLKTLRDLVKTTTGMEDSAFSALLNLEIEKKNQNKLY